jgi:hypothetical protein
MARATSRSHLTRALSLKDALQRPGGDYGAFAAVPVFLAFVVFGTAAIVPVMALAVTAMAAIERQRHAPSLAHIAPRT